ncbi:MAG: hypothetical protein ABI199_02065, partial [Bacteroidia bacterium]
YPKDKLAEIDKDIADANAAKSSAEKQKALDAQYQTLIANADKSLAGKDYDNAKTNYTQASSLKPNEQYPKDKLAEIAKDQANAQAAADAAAKQKALDAQYQTLIASADKSLAGKDYDNAKTNYTQASSLKPNEQYPKDKLAEIAKDQANAQAAVDAAAKQKALAAQYQTLIANADKSLAGKNYDNAKSSYTQASSLKPNEQYPKDKLAEIDKDIADANAAKSSVEKQKALDAQYQTLIASADKSLAGKNYNNAKTNYTQASSLKPNEQYPKDKLAEIDKDIADANAAKSSAEKQKALDAQYQTLIASADKSLAGKNYDNAKTNYTQASSLKPNEQYPKDKLAEIDKDIADANAAKSSAEKQKALDAQYQTLIASADKSLAGKDYDNAKTNYTQASSLKPNEQYPKDKLAEIDKTIAAEQATNAEKSAEAAKEKELNDQYAAAIRSADELLGNKEYDNAKKGYNNALMLKPAEQYPKDKIKEINADIAAMAASNSAAAEAAAKQKALDEKYDNLIATADEAKSASKYMDAKTAYQQASALKPNEEYPKDKIAEINNKEIALQEAAKKEAQYKLLIVKADQQFSTKKYKLAQAYYQQASTTKSDEQYPKDQLKKIDDLLHPKATTETPTNVATTVDPTTPTQDSVNPLVKEYGQGVTEQHTQDANTDVTVRIVVKGNYAYVYKKVVWNFGQVDYYKNDVPITSSTYENETSH